jgi:hypothetical protein
LDVDSAFRALLGQIQRGDLQEVERRLTGLPCHHDQILPNPTSTYTAARQVRNHDEHDETETP